jgi:phosphoglycerate kinase
MAKKNVASVDVSGKLCFIRVDFNVPLDGSKITDDRRIKAAIPTIKSVLDRGGRAILASHLGRPKGAGFEKEFTLAPCAKRLGDLLGKPVAFPSNDCIDDKADAAIKGLKNGECLLLENLRFHKGEEKGDAAFAAKLAHGAEVYINDAFGTAHRPHASMVGVPKSMAKAPKVAGFLMEKEIKFLSDAISNPAKPLMVILGGAKVSDKLPAIEHLLPKAEAVFVGGAMAYTFLRALGRLTGSSRVEEDRIPDAKRILEAAAKHKCKLYLPVDHICSTSFTEMGTEVKPFEDNIPGSYMGLDIGVKTQMQFATVLRTAKTIVWNGPMGVFEWPLFAAGTKAICSAVADATQRNGAISIVGGGDSAAAVEQFKMADRFSHVSTGGGASLEMLEGKKFDSVELLDNA